MAWVGWVACVAAGCGDAGLCGAADVGCCMTMRGLFGAASCDAGLSVDLAAGAAGFFGFFRVSGG